MTLKRKICARMKHYLLLLSLCLLAVVDAAAVKERPIYTFTGTSDGEYPTSLIADAAGNLYGVTEFTANYGPGTIFELVRSDSGYAFKVLYTFDGIVGYMADGPLALDTKGNLYGTSSTGGDYYKGSVFELSPSQGGSWTLSTLYSFSGGADGAFPLGGVIVDDAGNLYGTASEGGLLSDCDGAGCGVVFEVSSGIAGGWTQTTLHGFAEIEGALPSSGLIFGANRTLYGTTVEGGTNGYGTVFEVAPFQGGWTETTLHSFSDQESAPAGGLTLNHGRLFGMTMLGGTRNAGTVFELSRTKSGAVESIVHNFSGRSGGTIPIGSVVFDERGNLYGSASEGGNSGCDSNQGCGAIFELTPSNGKWTETILHQFSGGDDGGNPYGTPIIIGTGLFGIAGEYGLNGYGLVFALTP